MRVVRTATVPDMGRIQSTMVRGSVHMAQGTTGHNGSDKLSASVGFITKGCKYVNAMIFHKAQSK